MEDPVVAVTVSIVVAYVSWMVVKVGALIVGAQVRARRERQHG